MLVNGASSTELYSELRVTLYLIVCLSVCLSVSQSVLGLSPSMTPEQDFRRLRDRCHGASSLTGGRVCIFYPTHYWSLLHLTLYGVVFT